jgi:hypothetical protein
MKKQDKVDMTVETADERKSLADRLLAERDSLVGKEVILNNLYPKQSAEYRGRLEDIQLREDKLFMVLAEKPGETRSHLIGSKDDRFARDIARHIPRTRITIG